MFCHFCNTSLKNYAIYSRDHNTNKFPPLLKILSFHVTQPTSHLFSLAASLRRSPWLWLREGGRERDVEIKKCICREVLWNVLMIGGVYVRRQGVGGGNWYREYRINVTYGYRSK